ncbi:thioredoxin-like protein [Phlebopus sp. FC_14]|nr:thioredoxin-like protein [Phlebopus sp. FC_14]
MPEQITLYHDTRGTSLYSHKVELALLEANANYRSHKFNVYSKPQWYVTKVNPITGKIPAITYGGPADADPQNPPPESLMLIESQVILEFIADLYPDSGLLPSAPTSRAKVRLFMDVVSRHMEPAAIKFFSGEESYKELLGAIELVQSLLPDVGEFAVGETYTIADATVTPFIARLELASKTDLGRFTHGMGLQLGKDLGTARYAKFRKYMDVMLIRESTKKTFNMVRGIVEFTRVWDSNEFVGLHGGIVEDIIQEEREVVPSAAMHLERDTTFALYSGGRDEQGFGAIQ